LSIILAKRCPLERSLILIFHIAILSPQQISTINYPAMRLHVSKTTTLLTLLPLALADTRPADVPICDYYTTALLMNNTAANQLALLTRLVNTVIIGNYTTPNVGIAVPGILAPGTFNGTAVNLLPYFDGALLSTNDGGSEGSAVNFLDGGGAKPLMESKPADDDAQGSRQ
jgi:hypothetical protein